MKNIIDATKATSLWLKQYNSSSEQENIMLLNGINLVECIENGIAPKFFEERSNHSETIKSLNQLILMQRDELLNFCRTSDSIEQIKSIRYADIVLNHMSYSFARMDDLQMVSVLLRTLILTYNNINLSTDVWNYLFNQQQPDGSFGLFSAEKMLLNNSAKALLSNLIVTVEVLITFAVVTSKIVNDKIDIQLK